MWKLACILSVIALASASDVLELGDSDFDSTLADLDLVLVKFYAPWCGHCKKLAPEFDRAAADLKYDDPPVSLAKVDCTAEGKDVCSRYDVKGYPSLKAFKRGEVAFDYSGPREADGIVKYMRSKAGPSAKKLETAAAWDKFLGSQDAVVAGFFSDASSDAAKTFLKLADALNEDFRFGFTNDADLIKKYGEDGAIFVIRPARLSSKFEESKVKYDGDMKLSDVKSFVNDNIHGLAGHRTTGNQGQFQKPLVVAYYDVDYVKNAKGSNYWRNRVMKVAKKMQEAGKKVFFAVSNAGDFSHELMEYGLEGADKPVVAARNAKDEKFTMSQDFSMDNLEAFVDDLLDGKLEAYMKSEPIPANEGPLKTVVGKNFDEIVNDSERDVLIEFYAPWCGHCKSLAPKYEELAEKLEDEDSVTIAQMDATANDVPSTYTVKGFPTIFYAPKGSKGSPKKYEGAREVKDFIKYLAKESTDGFKGYDRSGKKTKVEL